MLMTHIESEDVNCPLRQLMYHVSMMVTKGQDAQDPCCWGKKCPMWRWYDREGLESDLHKPNPKKRRGYCGLAGQIHTAL